MCNLNSEVKAVVEEALAERMASHHERPFTGLNLYAVEVARRLERRGDVESWKSRPTAKEFLAELDEERARRDAVPTELPRQRRVADYVLELFNRGDMPGWERTEIIPTKDSVALKLGLWPRHTLYFKIGTPITTLVESCENITSGIDDLCFYPDHMLRLQGRFLGLDKKAQKDLEDEFSNKAWDYKENGMWKEFTVL